MKDAQYRQKLSGIIFTLNTQMINAQRDSYISVNSPDLNFIVRLALQHPVFQVMDFHQTFELEITKKPVDFRQKLTKSMQKLAALRRQLLTEEYEEYIEGDEAQCSVEMYDALLDIIYIAYGSLISYGFPAIDGMNEIHSSNMSKTDEDGNPIKRGDGKILKGPNFRLPDLESILSHERKAR